MGEILARAACHWMQATPRCEQQRLQQGVLLCIFGPRWALKAIDGRNADVVQDHLLRIRPGQKVMLLECDNRGVRGSGLTWSEDTAHVHPIHVEWHTVQGVSPVSEVVRDVGAGGASLHIHDLHIVIVRHCAGSLVSSADVVVRRTHTHGHCPNALLLPRRLFFDASFVIELPLALLHRPLQLTSEQPQVVVRLQAVTSCEDVHRNLASRQPIASVAHGGEADADATCSAS